MTNRINPRLQRAVGLVSVLLASCAYACAEVSAFMPSLVSTLPIFEPRLGAGTRGWSFGLAQGSSPISITQLGIYDFGDDGLSTAHDIGLWELHFGAPETFITSITIPAGTTASLINGYRYVSITPILVTPNQGFVLGAHFGADDLDDLARPIAGRFEASLRPGSWSLINEDDSFSVPTTGYTREEGLGNYRFYPVNFQFEIIPEPSTACLFALGLGGMLWVRRRTSRRDPNDLSDGLAAEAGSIGKRTRKYGPWHGSMKNSGWKIECVMDTRPSILR